MDNFGHSHSMCTLYSQCSTGKSNIYCIIAVCLDHVGFYGEACKYTVVMYASVGNVISWKVISEKESLTGDVSLRLLA